MKNDEKIKILKLNKAHASFLDYPDNESLAVIVYILGCDHDCSGCHNPGLQNPDYYRGDVEELTIDEFESSITLFSKKYRTNKIVLSGGDPLYFKNINFVIEFLKNTDYDVCIYTGFSVNYVKKLNISGFKFLKCEKYDSALTQVSKKTDTYMQFSSKNQKLYDSNFKLLSKFGRYYFRD